MERKIRSHFDKENDHKNMNKREMELHKIEKILVAKQANDKNIVALRNSKEMRISSKIAQEKSLKPIAENITNSQQYCQLYSEQISQIFLEEPSKLGNFLQKHDIDQHLRARMLDWMIEVISSYKFNPATYFSSVAILDRYFQLEEMRTPVSKLHITGVTAMLIATKMDEVYPLKVKTVYEKIVHKKIEKKDLIEMERRMTQKLDFMLNRENFYHLAMLKLHNKFDVRNEEVMKQIENICEYVGKYIAFSYDLYTQKGDHELSNCLLNAAFRVYGRDKIRFILGDKHNLELLHCQQEDIKTVFQTIKNFKLLFRNLNNIYKFSDSLSVQRVELYLQNN